MIGLMGLLGWWAGVAWLVPNLGPGVALQATKPKQPSAQAIHVGAGHFLGLLAGLGAFFVTGAADAQAVLSSGVLQGLRALAGAL